MIAAVGGRCYAGSMWSATNSRGNVAVLLLTDKDLRPRGTNGYTTSWGTNAHGKLAGVPPSPR